MDWTECSLAGTESSPFIRGPTRHPFVRPSTIQRTIQRMIQRARSSEWDGRLSEGLPATSLPFFNLRSAEHAPSLHCPQLSVPDPLSSILQ